MASSLFLQEPDTALLQRPNESLLIELNATGAAPSFSHDAQLISALSPLLTVRKVGSGTVIISPSGGMAAIVKKVGTGTSISTAGARDLVTGNKVGNPSTVIFSQSGAQFIDIGKKIGTGTARTSAGLRPSASVLKVAIGTVRTSAGMRAGVTILKVAAGTLRRTSSLVRSIVAAAVVAAGVRPKTGTVTVDPQARTAEVHEE